MVDKGYIRLWRKMKDTSFYRDSVAFHLACHLVMTANWKTRKTIFNGEETEVKRGYLITGRKQLSIDLGIKEPTVYKKLLLLENLGFCNINPNNKFSVIHIVNYNKYNPTKEIYTSPVTTTEQQRNTSKEVKELKKRDNTVTGEFSLLMAKWNTFASSCGLPQCLKETPKRLSHFKNRKLEIMDNLEAIFREIHSSSFLLGKKSDWKVTLDFLLERKDGITKILEGQYRDKGASSPEADPMIGGKTKEQWEKGW